MMKVRFDRGTVHLVLEYDDEGRLDMVIDVSDTRKPRALRINMLLEGSGYVYAPTNPMQLNKSDKFIDVRYVYLPEVALHIPRLLFISEI
jgi:hypothetical protein